jgi:hypothetical protein
MEMVRFWSIRAELRDRREREETSRQRGSAQPAYRCRPRYKRRNSVAPMPLAAGMRQCAP